MYNCFYLILNSTKFVCTYTQLKIIENNHCKLIAILTFPSQGLRLIMQTVFAQEPQVRGYSLLRLGLIPTLTPK